MSRLKVTSTALAFSALAFSSSNASSISARGDLVESHDIPQIPVASLLELSSGGAIVINNRPEMLSGGVISVLLNSESSSAMLMKATVANPEANFLGQPTRLLFAIDFITAQGKLISSKLPLNIDTQVTSTSSGVLLKYANSMIEGKTFFPSGKSAIIQYKADLDPELPNSSRGKNSSIIAVISSSTGAISFKGLYPNGTNIVVSPNSDVAVINSPVAQESGGSSATNIQILTPQGIARQKVLSGFGTAYGWTKQGEVSFSGGDSIKERKWCILNPNTFEIRNSSNQPETVEVQSKQTYLEIKEDKLLESNVSSGANYQIVGVPGSQFFFLQAKPNGLGGILSVNPDGTACFSKTSPISSLDFAAYNKREEEFKTAFSNAKEVCDAIAKLTNGEFENLPKPDELKAELLKMGLSDEVLKNFEIKYSLPVSDPSSGILSITAGGRQIIINADGSRRVITL